LVDFHLASWCCITENRILHNHGCENLKSYISLFKQIPQQLLKICQDLLSLLVIMQMFLHQVSKIRASYPRF
jgi:hypothetical protein